MKQENCFETSLSSTTFYLNPWTKAQIFAYLVLIINIVKALEDIKWDNTEDISQFLRN